VPISALQGAGLPQLVRQIEEGVAEVAGVDGYDLEISPMDVAQVQYLYSNASVVNRAAANDEKERVKMRVTFTRAQLQKFREAAFKPLSMRKVPRKTLIRTHVAPASSSSSKNAGGNTTAAKSS
jgi:hypothetical protein